MDTTNSTIATTELLKQWWDAKNFDGKEFCSISENGELRVKPFDDKIVSVLNHITGDAVIQNLIEKFHDLTKQVNELSKEWNENEDKLKLMGKLNRLRDYTTQINAIGDFKAVLQTLKCYEDEINEILEKNYKEKLSLVAEAESISVENNNWKDITQKFKDITEKWKSLGYVDKKRNEELWEKLETIKSKFFEEKRSHHEDIGKEMLQNLDLKMELVEKAEAYANSENWKETTEIFKQLLEDWKKIGRTLPEKNEALWQKFIAAKNNFFDRKKLHTDQIKVEQEANYIKKSAIVEKAETIKDSTDWAITTQAYTDLMSEWKSIGSVPSEYGNSLWDRFSAAKEVFFNAKRAKTEIYKSMLEENLTKKLGLIEKAEAIKDSSNWRETTEAMNQLFEEWKTIGHVGKEHTETLWEKFIAARKHFFNRKDKDRERRDLDKKRKEQELAQERELHKQQEEKNKAQRIVDLKKTLEQMMFESKDEEAQIAEFKESIQTITDGPKSEELKTHLGQLVIEIEQRIKNRAPKIVDLNNQIERMEAEYNKTTENNDPSTVTS